MAGRTVIPIQQGVRSTAYLIGTPAAPLLGGTVIDQANGMYVAPKKYSRVVLLVYNSKAGNIQTTIKAGVYPPAEAAGEGDLVTAAIPTLSLVLFTGFNGSRFFQPLNQLFFDTDAGATGVVWCYELAA